MRILSLDISSKTGWAIVEGMDQPEKLISYGTCWKDKSFKEFGEYPHSYILLAKYQTEKLWNEVVNKVHDQFQPLIVVTEETNSGKNCYSQKSLEFMHYAINEKFHAMGITPKYIRTGVWRSVVGSHLSTEEKSLNGQIARQKKKTGKKLAKIDGKVVGRKGRKHVAIRRVEELFGIELLRKEEDAADAILLALSYLRGAPICNGTVSGGKLAKKGYE